jgi:energy-converting hydrogenase Eha subunit H
LLIATSWEAVGTVVGTVEEILVQREVFDMNPLMPSLVAFEDVGETGVANFEARGKDDESSRKIFVVFLAELDVAVDVVEITLDVSVLETELPGRSKPG